MSKFDDLKLDQSKMLEVMIPYFLKGKERVEYFNFYGLTDTPIKQFQNLITDMASKTDGNGRLYRRILKNDPMCKVKFFEADNWNDWLLSALMNIDKK
jgi:hypothetical protein